MKKLIRYLDYIIYWCIVLIPFSMAISQAPMNVFMGLAIAAFLAKKALTCGRIQVKTPLNLPLFLLLLITSLSLFNSVNLNDSIKGGVLRLLEYAFILFVVASELKDIRHLRLIVFSITIGLSLISFDEIWQVLSGSDFIRGYAPIINLGFVRARASFNDSNTLGVYLSALTPIVFGLTIYYFKGAKRILFIFISLLLLTALTLTYSRPTILAVYIALFFLGLVGKKRALVILLLIFALASPFIAPGPVKDWARQVGYNPLRFMCNDDRIAVYRNSLNMLKAHPLIGVGANNFMKSYKFFKQNPEYRNVVTPDYIYAHNNFLHLAAEVGLIGFIIFIWLVYKLLSEGWKVYLGLNAGYPRAIAPCILASLIAFLVNGLTESSLYYARVALIFWYLAGLSLSLNKFIQHGPLNLKPEL